ncbi:MAG: amidase family protein, partial [Actinomycetota bacterium]
MDLAGATASDIARAVGAREISPVEVVEATFERIDRLNPSVNAFAWLRDAGARADAKRAEAEQRARPLEGVPFTVKDLTAL